MPNEIIIRVKALNDTKAVFESIRADARALGDTIGIDVNKATSERLQKEAQASASNGGPLARAGDTIGDAMGKRISERISDRIKVIVNERLRRGGGGDSSSSSTSSSRSDNGGNGRDREHVTVDVDVNKQSFLQKLGGLASAAKDKISGAFGEGLKTGLTSVFSGDIISTIIKGVSITALAGALAPVLGAALTAAIGLALGGGVLAAGIISAFKDPAILSAASGLKDRAAKIFEGFGENFKTPILLFLKGIGGVIDQITPMIDNLGKVFGPIAGQLGQGLIGFLQNALPGILRATEAAAPLFQVLADNLPGLGDEIGKFFDHIKNGMPGAILFFDDLLHAVGLIIRVIGNVIEILSRMYSVVRTVITGALTLFLDWASGVLTAARIAFGWIPGLGPKIDTAADKFAQFRNKTNKYLAGIRDREVTVTVRQIFTTVGRNLVGLAGQLAGMRASGGVTATAASGGIRSGLTWVGERGPELIDAAPGSRVHSNADSNRMAGQGGGGWGTIIVPVIVDGREIARVTADPMRDMVRNHFGGSVQAAYGVN